MCVSERGVARCHTRTNSAASKMPATMPATNAAQLRPRSSRGTEMNLLTMQTFLYIYRCVRVGGPNQQRRRSLDNHVFVFAGRRALQLGRLAKHRLPHGRRHIGEHAEQLGLSFGLRSHVAVRRDCQALAQCMHVAHVLVAKRQQLLHARADLIANLVQTGGCISDRWFFPLYLSLCGVFVPRLQVVDAAHASVCVLHHFREEKRKRSQRHVGFAASDVVSLQQRFASFTGHCETRFRLE
jgi:hypothetical protein